jgi:Uma2 family endonuclease
MTPAPGLMTVGEYFRTPLTVKPMELARGRLRVADAPAPRHQAAVAALFRALDWHVRSHQLGEMWLAPLDVVLSEREAIVVQPDLFFISAERRQSVLIDKHILGAPDLVIEVLSPKPRIGDTQERVGWFAQYGVRECWLLHQAELTLATIEFRNHRIADRQLFKMRDPIRSSVLADFSASLADIFD